LHFSSSAEQNMGMPAVRTDSTPHRRWTTAQVRDLMDESRHWPRYELIDGELVVTPAPGYPHQIAVGEFLQFIKPYTLAEKVGIAVTSPADLELRVGTITQPDVFVIPKAMFSDSEATPNWSDVTGLVLAIEIISPSSISTDRITKRDFYLGAGVAEYWIVDLDARIVERWIPSRETPELARTSLEWLPAGAASSLTIDLAELFERIWRQHRLLFI
jgi:Uma2 family endonuclease